MQIIIIIIIIMEAMNSLKIFWTQNWVNKWKKELIKIK